MKGFVRLLKPEGVASFEFPHLLNLVQLNQFDTIYHEHFSYLSLTAIRVIFEANGLRVFDVEQLQTHGGSLRIYAQRSEAVRHKVNERVFELQKKEDLKQQLDDIHAVMFELESLQDNCQNILLDIEQSKTAAT